MKQFDSFRLDTANECLWHDNLQIAIPPKPFAVLRYLVERPGRLVSHDELLDALWPETYVQPQVLRTYVLDLRKVLGDDAGKPRFIQTLPKRGYCFVAQVVEGPEATSASPPKFQPGNKSIEIFGRERELAQLDAQLNLAASSQRRLVLVEGEAGIGKTALLDAFCRVVELSQSAAIARGQCIEGIAGQEDLYPVFEALGHLCASPDGERACRTLARMAPAWLARGMSSNSPSDSLVEAKIPERTLGDICAALEELSAEKPLILIFEDLEWADESTLNLISALARRRSHARLVVLGTLRPRRGPALQELKQDLLLRRLCIEIVLGPLTKPAIKNLLRRELKAHDMPDELDHFVYRHAEGNPLFAVAILEHLIAQRILAKSASDVQWELSVPIDQAEAGVPGQLARMIEIDIERLTDEEQAVLEAGSLMSVAFPAWAVAAALQKPLELAEEACNKLARRLYFLDRGGQDELPDGTRSSFYLFTHQLFREVIYQRQASTQRDSRHIRIADRLRELFAGHEEDVARETAMHYEAGGDWLRAGSALRLAAQRAQRRNAYADAAELLERALRLSDNLSGCDCDAFAAATRIELARVRRVIQNPPLLEEESSQKV